MAARLVERGLLRTLAEATLGAVHSGQLSEAMAKRLEMEGADDWSSDDAWAAVMLTKSSSVLLVSQRFSSSWCLVPSLKPQSSCW